jgi:hypothetical protein
VQADGSIEWQEGVDLLRQHIVRISTPRNSGTGFLLSYLRNRRFCAIATAAHVVDHAHYWEQPIKIEHPSSAKSVLLRPGDRAAFLNEQRDTAAIAFATEALPLPESPEELIEEAKYLRVGNEIGWLGFPAVSPRNLCFFSGRVSYFLEDEHAYLVDGVAINGVSGGPTFFLAGPGIYIIGVVSAYIANRATGETLPGLSVVRDVSHFQELLKDFTSLEEAKAEESQLEAPPPPEPEGGA